MTAPPGLHYYPNVIDEELAERLTAFLATDCEMFPVPGRGGKVGANPRYVAHYGYRYDYTSGGVTEPATPFPGVIGDLCAEIYTAHPDIPDEYWFDQCIINRYSPGQGIGAHYDRKEYGPIIACFTFGSGAEMEFTRSGHEAHRVYTEPGSLYVMTGESRYDWLHQMRGRISDPGHGKRGVRWSLTFRSVGLDDE